MGKQHKLVMKEWFADNDARKQAQKAVLRKLAGVRKREAILAKHKDAWLGDIFPRWVQNFIPKEGVRTSTFEGAYSFQLALQKKGFEQLGSGVASTVMGHPSSDKVIKIIRSVDGWMDYVKWATKEGYSGTFAPKVYSYKWLDKGGFGLAVMERLDTTLSRLPQTHDYSLMHKIIDHAVRYENKMSETMVDLAIPGVGKFLRELRVKFGTRLDLHGGNFMIRNTGDLVLIDPVSFSGSKDYKERFKLAA